MQKNIIVMEQNPLALCPMQFGWESCAPSHFFGPSVRDYWLLHYVVRGEGRFHREGQIHSVGAGEIFVIEPGMETYYEADSSHPWEYIWIGFTVEGNLPKCFFDPILRCNGAGDVFYKMKDCKDWEGGRTAFLAGCLWKLIALLQEQGRREPKYKDLAIQCMRAEYHTGITVSEIAARLNLDRSYFSNYFKKETGLSPQQYLTALRMERASVLLRRDGVRPTIAASSIGYSDLFTFSKAFKKYFGVSPREYQNKL